MKGTFRLASYDERYEYIKVIRDILNNLEKLMNSETSKKNIFIESVLQSLFEQIENIDENYLYPFLDVEDFEEENILKYICEYNSFDYNLNDNFIEIYKDYKKGKINKESVEYKMLKTLLNEWERNEFLEKIEKVREKRKNIKTSFILKKENNDNLNKNNLEINDDCNLDNIDEID